MSISGRGRRRIVWLAGILGIAVLLSAVALVVTSQPRFCRSCHLMETRYVSWKRSAHYGEADCLDCHAEPGLLGEIAAHLNGARYLYVLVTGRPQVILRAQVPPGTCAQCHPPESLPDESRGVDVAHDNHDAAGVACESCHSGFHDDVLGGSMASGLSPCSDCHGPSVLIGRETGRPARADESWSVDGVR